MKINIELIRTKLTKKLGRKASQQDIAELLGTNQVHIHRMLKTKDSKLLDILSAASKKLNIKLEKLIIE